LAVVDAKSHCMILYLYNHDFRSSGRWTRFDDTIAKTQIFFQL